MHIEHLKDCQSHRGLGKARNTVEVPADGVPSNQSVQFLCMVGHAMYAGTDILHLFLSGAFSIDVILLRKAIIIAALHACLQCLLRRLGGIVQLIDQMYRDFPCV